MRIPDGDLMPARRHRYNGGYGRRRRRRGWVLVLVLLLLAAGAAWFLRRDGGTAGTAALASCPTATPTPTTSPAALPANRLVRVVLRNGTVRQGLAHTVSTQLKARGFVVVREDNNPSALAGASVVTYATGLQGAATVLARNVFGARVSGPGRMPAGTVQLVLGSDFRRLATPAEVQAAGTATPGAAVVPAPTRSPCAA